MNVLAWALGLFLLYLLLNGKLSTFISLASQAGTTADGSVNKSGPPSIPALPQVPTVGG